MFTELVGGDGMTMMGFDINEDPTAKKRARGTTTSKGKAAKRSNSRC
jgi:hypothetical protein